MRCCPSEASSSNDYEIRTSGPGARTFGEGSNLTPNPFTISPKPLKINLATYENKVEFRQSNRSRAFIEGEDEQSGTDYLSIGNILHEVLSHIRTTADIAPTIRRFQLEGLLTPSLLSSLNSKLSTLNSKTDWFSDKWTLFNECTILSQENGILKERRPDRVMTDGTKWIVVDFKFGTPKPEHKTQVREYMTLLHQMHPNQTIMGYLWYVYPNKIIEV